VAPVDPIKKQEKTKIRVKLPDETNYQIAPFRAGSNEDYVNHIIAMLQLVQQKELESTLENVFGAVSDIRDKIGHLYKKLNMASSIRRRTTLTNRSRLLRKIWIRQRKWP
jgi:hypothetical protein